MKLEELVGSTVLMMIPRISQKKQLSVKLLGVESGGIWIESQGITNAFLQLVGMATAPRTPIFFVPYQEIAVVVHTLPQPSLDEKAFGV